MKWPRSRGSNAWKSEEAGEAILFATAVRETEELALAPSDIVARGFLSLIVTVTNFYVEPCVEALPQPYVWKPAEAGSPRSFGLRSRRSWTWRSSRRSPCPDAKA